ncbi:MAG: fatty acid desaturase [Alphaproteobacteria bacterium]|nr:fatty acid desaturase [Alphaproteobacteria bacterium]
MTNKNNSSLQSEISRHPLVIKADRLCHYYEVPTWIVTICVYSLWLTLTFYFQAIPWYAMAILAPLTIAWHGSLRHEATHNHPINRKVATLVGYPPLNLCDPFVLYRESHQRHHRNEHLTDPYEDPESFFYRKEDWESKSWLMQKLWIFNQTFFGRMTIGPAIIYGRWYVREVKAMLLGDTTRMRIWAEHAIIVAALLYWVTQICGIALWQYVVFFAYPGISIGLIRSFYEHRYDASPLGRCVLVERSPFFQMLFLNNNFHAVHHDKPGMPWYQIDEYYRARKEYYQQASENYVVESYGQLMREFMFKPIFYPVHPLAETSHIPPEEHATHEKPLVDAVLPIFEDDISATGR